MPGQKTFPDKIVLERRITLLGGVALIVGSIIGSGVFVSPGGVLMHVQAPGVALLLWAFGGIFCLIGALCFSELGTMLPEAGGEYMYILVAFGDHLAFLTLWMNVVVIRPATQAVLAKAFAQYSLKLFFPTCDPPENALIILGAAGIFLLTVVNCYSVKLAMRIQTLFTAAKLLAVVVIIGAGVIAFFAGNTSNINGAFDGNYSAGQVSLGLYSALFAFGGWNYLNLVTEELQNPNKNLPRAIWIALPTVAVIYILMNLSYLAVLTPQQIISSKAVAVDFGERVLGPLQYFVPVFVALSTFGSLNGILFTSGRLFLAGASQGHLPPILSYIDVNSRTPTPALLVTCLVSLFFLDLNLFALIECLSFVLWISFALATAALIYLRRSRPELPRPIRVHISLPFIFLGFCIFLSVFSLYQETISTGIGLLITLCGIPVYLVGVKMSKPKSFHRFHWSLTIQLQKLLNVVAPDVDYPLLGNGDSQEL